MGSEVRIQGDHVLLVGTKQRGNCRETTVSKEKCIWRNGEESLAKPRKVVDNRVVPMSTVSSFKVSDSPLGIKNTKSVHKVAPFVTSIKLALLHDMSLDFVDRAIQSTDCVWDLWPGSSLLFDLLRCIPSNLPLNAKPQNRRDMVNFVTNCCWANLKELRQH